MKRISDLTRIPISILSLLTLANLPTHAQTVIPQPMQMERGQGDFRLDSATRIQVDANERHRAEAQRVAEYLAEQLAPATGFNLSARSGSESSQSILLTTRDADASLAPEGYQLSVTPEQVVLRAPTTEGLFRGAQTIRQLLPASIQSSQTVSGVEWTMPAVEIRDKPRFQWRGINIDVSRHFHSKDFIKRYIDLLAYYKMNTLHWHLTDDQGWRIEIGKYPKLTEIGAWRMEEDGRYGGFYTQDEIREVVEYAKSRYIEVVPEIEMPGHSLAALAAYPELSCTGGPFEVATDGGWYDPNYCGGKEATFEFLEGVLLEVFELFPSQYVHLGGDEVPFAHWEACDDCQARMQAEGIDDMEGLQSYFMKRMAQFVKENGKRPVGWHDTYEPPENLISQIWRARPGQRDARQDVIDTIRAGHDVIASHNYYSYFNFPLSRNNLLNVYHFDPMPKGLTPEEQSKLLGGECNIWAENAPTEKVDGLVFPRILAYTEVMWSPPMKSRFEAFQNRVADHYKRLDLMGVTYGAED